MQETSPIFEEIQYSSLINSGVRLFVLRDDLRHPFLNGNKWRKLKYNIPLIKANEQNIVVTFGGAWSNHLVATAAAGKIYNFNSIGIVRGDECVINDALQFAKESGMQLYYISREKYRLRNNPDFLIELEAELRTKFPEQLENRKIYFLPEGGSNDAAVKGCSEIPASNSIQTDFICCACGTGATLAGIAKGLKPGQKAIGILVLKAELYLRDAILKWGASSENFELKNQFTFGGYAKSTKVLLDFCRDFSAETNIPVEPVYTGKLFFGLIQLIQEGYFPKGSCVTAVHTGGIFDFKNPLIIPD